MSEGVNFAKDYQNDSYSKKILKDKNLLARFKKHSYPKKLSNPKTLKIQGTFQN
jgi:hypothetical protein